MSIPVKQIEKITKIIPDLKSKLKKRARDNVSVACTLQNQFRLNRHHQIIKTFLGIDLKHASIQNFRLLRSQLKAGAHYLTSCLETPGATLSAEEHLHFHNQFLLPHELQLFKLFISSLTLKHATSCPQEIIESGEMLSLKERERLKLSIQNRHTYTKYGVDDDVYFVLGIGNHQTPSFLSDATHEMSIQLLEMAKQDKNTLDRLWVGGHLSDYINEIPSHPYLIGDAKYYYTHTWETRTKTYHIERADGTHFKWTISMDAEVLAGAHVISGIAFKFILMLRFLGHNNPYVQKLYTHTLNPQIEHAKKEEILSCIMSILFPGWVYPEAKIAVKVNVNKSYIRLLERTSIKEANESQEILMRNSRIFANAVEEGNIEKVTYLLQQGFSPNLRWRLSNQTPLMIAIEENHWNLARLLIQTGADINLKQDAQISHNALHYAVLYGTPEFLDFILQCTFPHEHAPGIQCFPNIYVKDSLNIDLIGMACSLGQDVNENRYHNTTIQKDIEAKKLKILLNYFPNISKNPNAYEYMDIAAKYSHLEAIIVLGNLKINLNAQSKFGKTALMTMVEKHTYNAELAVGYVQFLLECDANPNTRYQSCTYSALAGKTSYDSPDNGKTALHFAVQKGHVEVVKLLVHHGANCFIKTADGKTVLDIAEKSQREDVSEFLKAAMKTSENMTHDKPLKKHKVAESKTNAEEFFVPGTESVVCIVLGENKHKESYVLLGRKRNKDGQAEGDLLFPGGYRDREDISALDAAIRELQEETGLNLKKAISDHTVDALEILKVKLQKSSRKKKTTTFFLFDIRRLSSTQKLIMIPGDDLIELKKVYLKEIIIENSIYGLVIRKSNAMLIENLKQSPVFKLTPEQEKAVFEMYQIEEYGDDFLVQAVMSNDLPRMQYLLQKNPALARKEKNVTCLIHMIENNNLHAINLLLDYGANINGHYTCMTPLNAAVQQNNIDLIRFLLSKGALINKSLDVYFNPLLEAISLGSIEILDILIKAGADVNCANNSNPNPRFGSTKVMPPVMIAIKKGRFHIVKHLIENHGENLNLEWTPIKRNTPLLTAIRYQQFDIAWYLLTQIPDLKLKNKEGFDALDLLQQEKHEEMSSVLQFLNQYPTPYHVFASKCGVLPESIQVVQNDKHENCFHITFKSLEDAKYFLGIVSGTLRTNETGKPYVRLGAYRYAKLGNISHKHFNKFFNTYLQYAKDFIELPCMLQKLLYELFNNELQQFTYEHATYHESLCKVQILFIRAIVECKSLIEFTQDCRDMSEPTWNLLLTAIKKSASLQTVTLSNLAPSPKALTELAIVLKASSSVQNIIIGEHQFSVEDIFIFLDHFKMDSKIKSITLYCKGTTNIVKQMSTFMQNTQFIVPIELRSEDMKIDFENAQLKRIQVENRLAWTFHMAPEHLKTTISTLRTNENLKHLSFYELSIDQTNLLMHHLKTNNQLIRLSLSYCHFSHEGIQHLLKFICTNKNLRYIELDGSTLSQEVIHGVLQAILFRKIPFMHLSLKNMCLSSEDIQDIVHVLNCPSTQLRSLSLSYSRVLEKEKWLSALNRTLAHNQFLKHLNVSFTGETVQEQEMAFVHALSQNKNLISIDETFGRESAKAIHAILKRNITIARKSNFEGFFWLHNPHYKNKRNSKATHDNKLQTCKSQNSSEKGASLGAKL